MVGYGCMPTESRAQNPTYQISVWASRGGFAISFITIVDNEIKISRPSFVHSTSNTVVSPFVATCKRGAVVVFWWLWLSRFTFLPYRCLHLIFLPCLVHCAPLYFAFSQVSWSPSRAACLEALIVPSRVEYFTSLGGLDRDRVYKMPTYPMSFPFGKILICE